MNAQASTQILFSIDGRTIVAQPGPEDQQRLAELAGEGRSVKVAPSDSDTEGHAMSDDITVDVEGHAMTLRLPNAGDAAAVRRALAIGTLTASVAIGGFAAGTYVRSQPQAPTVNVPQVQTITRAAPMGINDDEGLADSASRISAQEFAASRQQTTVVLPAQAPVTVTTTTESPDQDVNLANRGHAGGSQQSAEQPQPPQAPRQGGSQPE